MLFIGLTAGCKMQNAECKIEIFPSEMNMKYFYFVRKADTFILHFASYILHFVVNNNLPHEGIV